MIINGKRITVALMCAAIICSLFLFAGVLLKESRLHPGIQTLDKVGFIDIGTTNNMTLEVSDNPGIALTGHFDKEILVGQTLLFRMKNIRVRIYQNDVLIYSYGQPGSYPSFSKSPGNTWQTFHSPAILPEDELRIELESVYVNNVNTAYSDFINQMFVGDSGLLLQYVMEKTGFTVILGGIACLAGGMLASLAFILRLFKTPLPAKIYYLSLFAVTSGLWFFFDFQVISLIFPFGVFNNVLSMVCLCMTIPSFGLYILQFIHDEAALPVIVVTGVQIVFTIFYIIAQWLGIYDGFELLTPLTILIAVGMLCILCALLYETLYRKNKETRFLLLSCVVLLLVFADIKDYMVDLSPSYMTTKVGYILFISIHFIYAVQYIHKSIRELRAAKKMEEEIAQSRVAIAISQIQPHFLYNTLTAIKQLCVIDPVTAEKAVGDFSSFLRGNLDSITSRTPIPFEKELGHVKNYLSLEQLRFGNRLAVRYDLQTTRFQLPSLSIQTLVENAVRYGVTKQARGGTVTIITLETDTDIVVKIIDDGVGFVPEEKLGSERAHIGIENVQNRLRAQCHGNLMIDSAPGQGTRATIIIRKEVMI